MTVPVCRMGLGVVYLQIWAGGSGYDGTGLFLGVLGLALDLGNRRNVVPGLGVRPIRAGHTLLRHCDHPLPARSRTRDCISSRDAA